MRAVLLPYLPSAKVCRAHLYIFNEDWDTADVQTNLQMSEYNQSADVIAPELDSKPSSTC